MRQEEVALVLFADALIISVGFLLVAVACHLSTWHAAWCVLFACMSLLWPTMCDGCDFADMDPEYADVGVPEGLRRCQELGYFMMGATLFASYGVIILLFRNALISVGSALLALAGNTLVLAAVFIFVRVFVMQTH